jgi:hypothetical protein
MIHTIQLCQRCFKIAKRYAWTQPKSDLWRTLKRKLDIFKTRAKRGSGNKTIEEQDM